ncbi:MAG: hypothetical protein COC15_04675 [Legionellales bacterium]|nr:MAG: hypothetical protein COC15_04675 [Legionellales bacterium]
MSNATNTSTKAKIPTFIKMLATFFGSYFIIILAIIYIYYKSHHSFPDNNLFFAEFFGIHLIATIPAYLFSWFFTKKNTPIHYLKFGIFLLSFSYLLLLNSAGAI